MKRPVHCTSRQGHEAKTPIKGYTTNNDTHQKVTQPNDGTTRCHLFLSFARFFGNKILQNKKNWNKCGCLGVSGGPLASLFLFSHIWLGLPPPIPCLPHLFLKPISHPKTRWHWCLHASFWRAHFVSLFPAEPWTGGLVTTMRNTRESSNGLAVRIWLDFFPRADFLKLCKGFCDYCRTA